MVIPPSTSRVWPVMERLASEARNTTAPSRSAGMPGRRSDCGPTVGGAGGLDETDLDGRGRSPREVFCGDVGMHTITPPAQATLTLRQS